jgi:tetratricopeptide (TPR) repeat protein
MLGRMNRSLCLIAALLVGLVAAGPAAAAADKTGKPLDTHAVKGPKARYTQCMNQARKAPAKALKAAVDWADKDGGAPAQHCMGVALYTLGHYTEAADTFERIVPKVDARLQSLLLAQAAQAWLQEGRIRKAYHDQSEALTRTPKDPELWIDRSITLADAGKYWDAVDDLNHAHDLAPKRADVLILRAGAYRHLKTPELAADDLKRALKLVPNDPGALLERGLLRKMQGNAQGAREDWMTILRTAPNTPAAKDARKNLEAMDVQTN